VAREAILLRRRAHRAGAAESAAESVRDRLAIWDGYAVSAGRTGCTSALPPTRRVVLVAQMKGTQ
jgi:hypothetical protein